MATETNDRVGLKQARFTQEKLASYYEVVYKTLWRWRDVFRLIQEVLLWKKPVFSLALFVAVHWAFYHITMQGLGAVSLVLTVAIFALIVDAIWRLATAKNGSNRKRMALKTTPSFYRLEYVPFESALVTYHTPLAVGEMRPFSSICVTLAHAMTWADMSSVAMTTKVRESPLLLAAGLIGSGAVVFAVGMVIPPIVLSYLIVMGCLCWPFMECYQMGDYVTGKIGPWLKRVDLEVIKSKIFREEAEDEYDFAIDDSMTSEAFSRALGARTVGRSSSKTRVGMPTIREAPPPSAVARGGMQPSPSPPPPEGEEDLFADPRYESLDPHYDSLIADLASGVGEMPSMTSDLGAVLEGGGGVDYRDSPDVGGTSSSGGFPGGTPSRHHAPAPPPVAMFGGGVGGPKTSQGRVKKRKLPKRSPIPAHSGWGVTTPTVGGVLSSPEQLGGVETPGTQGGVGVEMVHSTPLPGNSSGGGNHGDQPPSYEEVLSSQGTEEYAGFYRGENQKN